MINVSLSKKDVVNLLMSTVPPYSRIEEFEKKGMGKFSGGFRDEWTWDKHVLLYMDINELYNIYTELKN